MNNDRAPALPVPEPQLAASGSVPPLSTVCPKGALTDDQIDRLQEEYDCFGECDAPRIHDFARAVESAVRAAVGAGAAELPEGRS